MDAGSRVVLNVSGVRHETYEHVLKKHPATRLSRLTPNLNNYDASLNEYYFDRHPAVFAIVLNYYRTGKLHYPTNVCGPLFETELEFWGLDANQVEPCCWKTYTSFQDTGKILVDLQSMDAPSNSLSSEEISKKFGWENDYYNNKLSWWQHTKPNIWRLFERPWGTRTAKILSAVTVTAILLDVLNLCLRTMPSLQKPNVSAAARNKAAYESFRYAQDVCNVWFLLEFLTRLAACPNKTEFIRRPLNIGDFIATLSFYIDALLRALNFDSPVVFEILEFLAIARMTRLMRLIYTSSHLKLLLLTFKASANELLLLFYFILWFAAIFAALIYYAERRLMGTQFNDIIAGFWWALISLTTVGYGDKTPQSVFGKVIAAMCGICGILVVSLPIPFVVTNFISYSEHKKARSKLPTDRRTRVLQLHEVKSLMAKRPMHTRRN